MVQRTAAVLALLLATAVPAQDAKSVANARELAALAANAKTVTLRGFPVDALESLARFESLEVLHVHCSSFFEDEHTRALTDLANLRTLRIERARLSRKGLTRLARFPRLEAFELFNEAGSPDDYQALTEFVALRRLRLRDDFSGERRKILDTLSKLSRLTHLSLRDSGTLDSAGAKRLVGLTGLESLDLSGCNGLSRVSGILVRDPRFNGVGIDDDALLALATLTQLHELGLANCHAITAKGIAAVRGMKQLHLLDVNGCTGIAEFGAELLPASLRELRAHGTSISGEALTRLEHLERVDFSWATKFADEDLAVLRGRPLRIVDLTYCKALSPTALETISTWKRLEHLDLFGMRWLRDGHLATLAKVGTLRHLAVGGNLEYTDAGLAQLANLKELEFLDVRACKKLTTEGFGKLRGLPLRLILLSSCPRIDADVVQAWFPKARLR